MILLICILVIVILLFISSLSIFFYERKKINELLSVLKMQEEQEKRLIKNTELLTSKLTEKNDQQEIKTFLPYIGMAKKDIFIYDENFIATEDSIKKNGFFTIIYEKNGFGLLLWYRGWVLLEEIIKDPEKKPIIVATKTKTRTAIFNGPGQGYYRVGTLEGNTPVEVLETFNFWKKIRISEGQEGYVWFSNLI